MKKCIIAILLLFGLSACLTTSSKYTPVQLTKINSIKFIKLDDLPPNQHIKLIGKTTGNYNTTYGNHNEMEWEMRQGAFSLNGDAILPYSTSRQYVSFANATIVNGEALVVSYIEPEKNIILSDYAKGASGGLLALSAARFAHQYTEAETISKNIIKNENSKKDGNEIVKAALNVLAKTAGRNSADYFFDFITNSNDDNSFSALKAFSPLITNQDNEKLVRFLKYHQNDDIKIESAKLLIKLGQRKSVEEYFEKTNDSRFAKLLM